MDAGGHRFPVCALALGSTAAEAPTLGFLGGVHGLERIGTRVLLAFLESLLAPLQRDAVLQAQRETVRLVFMPLINPAGMWRSTRCNANGVDLARNAPVESTERTPPLVSRHQGSTDATGG